jgi:membrane-bound lytic murein transglycosylase D
MSKDAGSPPVELLPQTAGSASHGRTDGRPVVKDFMHYFQGPGLKSYRASVNRLQAYRLMIARILREEGLPPVLLWIGLVESGYDPRARSPKSALGIWQLIPRTATTFGLTVGRQDERTDPEKSTLAAARYLKYLYARFGDWMLALAAHNAGEQRVQAAIEQARDRDFWRLSASGMLPRETQAYVPAVLAAQLLGADPAVSDGSSPYDDATSRTARIAVAPFSLSR